jgi:preprotein translocase subunit SecE
MAKATTAGNAALDGKAAKPDKPVKSGKPGRAPSAEKPNLFARLVSYLRDVRAEMTRVVWPTRPEVLNSSVVVITTLLFFILLITLVDQIVIQFLKLLARLG